MSYTQKEEKSYQLPHSKLPQNLESDIQYLLSHKVSIGRNTGAAYRLALVLS